MTKTFSAILVSVALAIAASVAHAEVKVVVLGFVPATPDYVVPPGKVLLIEHLSPFYGNFSGGNFDKVVITISSPIENSTGILTVPWSFSTSNAAQSIHLERPIRAAAGSSVNIFDTFAGAAQDVRIQGLLVDQADLYAANLGIDLKGVSLADQRLTARVELSSARPAILDSETSPNLQTWVDNLTQIVSRQDRLVYDVSTEVSRLEARKFLRVSARTPEIP